MNLDLHFRRSLSPASEQKTALLLVVAAGAFQGALMGSYALWNGGSPLFVLWGALKVPILLGLAGALCFPIARVLSLLLGIADEFAGVTRELLSVQVAFAAILAATAPLSPLLYASGVSYRGALVAQMGLWIFAALVAAARAKNRLTPQLRSDKKLRLLLCWGFALWAFVAVQTGWSLRPFIGRPDSAPQFLRHDALSNAYVELGKMALTRSPD